MTVSRLPCYLLISAGLACGANASEPLHWAFIPPQKEVPPEVRWEGWNENTIDRFVGHTLEMQALSPAPPADRPALLRRAYITVIGLPPTPEQLDAFVKDPRSLEDAFADVVDHLLASPHYGERWGRHWLDIARYGDSNGGDENHAYPNAYHYRNWVIDALNRDLPYDAFLRHQIAGDLIDSPTDASITATGFLAIGTKILAEQDPVKKRADVVDEQIDTMGRAFMALTLGCARCHDHKFDPVSQKEYFALAGIFQSTAIDNAKGLPSADELALKEALKDEIEALKNQVAQAEAALKQAIDTTAVMAWEAETHDRGNVEIDSTHYGKGIGIISNPVSQLNYAEYDLKVPKSGTYLLQIRYAAEQSRPGKVLINGAVVIEKAIHQTTGGWMPEHQTWVLEDALALSSGKQVLRVESEPMMSHLDKIRLSLVRDAVAATSLVKDLEAKQKALTDAQAAFAKEPEKNVMAVHDGTVANAKINRRGDPHDLGAEVPRGVLHQLGTNWESSIKSTKSGRQALADWLTQPGHPLTSRVMVNRIWRWHFGGKALVESPDDFGTRGQQPTHPELLDYLALEFEASGWSLKALHKQILLSKTWQMSGDHPHEATMRKRDPENRYYWRVDPRRLEAETFRDAVLAVSGALKHEAPEDAPPEVKAQDPSPQDLEKNRKVYEDYPHRSVYLPVVRCHVYDLLTLLDFPNATSPVGERDETTVPTQALLMLNNPWLTKQADLVAKRANRDANRLYQILYSRKPSPAELTEAQAFLARYTQLKNETAAWTALSQTLMIANEFFYVR